MAQVKTLKRHHSEDGLEDGTETLVGDGAFQGESPRDAGRWNEARLASCWYMSENRAERRRF
jgi:hypothetical protein